MTDAPTTVARLTCDEPMARRLAGTLGELLGTEDTACAAFEDEAGCWQVAIHFRNPPDEAALRAHVALAADEEAAAALTIEPVAPANWVRQSLAGLPPVRAGRFLVYGAHDRARVRVNDIGLEIEAALAFGTGHHGTTRGCLLALDALAKRCLLRHPAQGPLRRASKSGGRSSLEGRRSLPPGASRRPVRRLSQGNGLRSGIFRILDVGTGSGVLAIAAAKLRRTRVVAADIDRVAVGAARANARLNGTRAITFAGARGTNARAIARGAPYDLIFANILLGPLTRLAVPLRRLAAPRAWLALSGLLPAHTNAALAIYRAQGFALERRIPLEGWVTLLLKRGDHAKRACTHKIAEYH